MALLDLLRITSPQSLVGPGIHGQGLSARDEDPRRLQALNFLRAIGQESDRADLQIPQDLRRARIGFPIVIAKFCTVDDFLLVEEALVDSLGKRGDTVGELSKTPWNL
jgi:hypothetical protein